MPVVAILNGDDHTLELIRTASERAGFIVVSSRIRDVREGKLDLVNFVTEHDPCRIRQQP
jgi:hypothetical protein